MTEIAGPPMTAPGKSRRTRDRVYVDTDGAERIAVTARDGDFRREITARLDHGAARKLIAALIVALGAEGATIRAALASTDTDGQERADVRSITALVTLIDRYTSEGL